MLSSLVRRSFATLVATVALVAGCQTDPTEAVVVNALPANAAEPLTVYRAWYLSTLYVDPVAPESQSEQLRVGAGAEPAYALLAVAYDPEVGPVRLVPARTRENVRLEAGETARVVFSASSSLIGCDGPDGLSREQYEFLAARIFPGERLAELATGSCAAWSAALPDGGTQ